MLSFPLVFQLISQQDYSKTTGPIFMQLGGRVAARKHKLISLWGRSRTFFHFATCWEFFDICINFLENITLIFNNNTFTAINVWLQLNGPAVVHSCSTCSFLCCWPSASHRRTSS